ncbi:MAG TPA: hypothetical protein VMV72_08020 [Verrucomicrobiae bacterium]|nr:hypothetical protein [Verrucomicrobiae bacterium]
MKSWRRLLICLAVVSVFYAFHVHLKTAKIFANPTWNAQDEVGQFWSEFAFQYRFAKFFASHPVGEWGRLHDDRDVQYPNAIDDWAEFTVAMEVPVGVLYRWIGGEPPHPNPLPQGGRGGTRIPFHVFVVWYDCLISSLSVFGVFFLARALWRSGRAGLFASALYVALYPSYGRTVKNLFLREDFAIPLIIFALYFTIVALQRAVETDETAGYGSGEAGGRVLPQFLAAVFWLAALASWHLTQFVMAPFVVAAVVVYLGRGETPRIPWLVLVLAAGSLMVPVLRAKQVFLSPTMCVLYALALAVWINGGRRRAILVFAGWAAALLALSTLTQRTHGEYAHVYELFFCKLRFLGRRPADPALLPWEARLLWESAFDTADWGQFWQSLTWCGPLALAAAMVLGSRKRGACATNIFIVFTLLLAPLAWMVVRYFTFLGFAAAVLAAGLVTRRFWWKLIVFAAAVAQLVALDGKPLDRQLAPEQYRPIVSWLEAHTPTNAVVLASIADSPVFLAETGRPIIMHSKFENQRIRDRYREMLEAIYGSEEQFYGFAKKYGADYFVDDVGFLYDGTESRRYKADKLGPLDPDCAAELFQHHPERLRHFKLETADERFAVFRVIASPSP